MSPEQLEVLATHGAWIEAVNSGDAETLLRMMADDVRFFDPGKAPTGRDGFGPEFLAAHREWQIECRSEPSEVTVVGDLAYVFNQDRLVCVRRSGGEVSRLSGHSMMLYRRQSDGRWLISRAMHNLVEQRD